MIGQWLKNIQEADAEDAGVALDFERVTAHLLAEVARADYEIEQAELDTIAQAIATTSSLELDEITSIVSAASKEVDDHISYHAHIDFIK